MADLDTSRTHGTDYLRFAHRYLIHKWIPGDRITLTWPAMVNVSHVMGAALIGSTIVGKQFTFVLPGVPSPSLFQHPDGEWQGAFEVMGGAVYRGLGPHALDHPTIACASQPVRFNWPPPPPPMIPPLPALPPGMLPQYVLAAQRCELGGEAQVNLVEATPVIDREAAQVKAAYTSELLIRPAHWRPSWIITLRILGLDDLSVAHVSGPEPVVRHATFKPTGDYVRYAYGRLGASTYWNGANLVVNEMAFLLTQPATINERRLGFLVRRLAHMPRSAHRSHTQQHPSRHCSHTQRPWLPHAAAPIAPSLPPLLRRLTQEFTQAALCNAHCCSGAWLSQL